MPAGDQELQRDLGLVSVVAISVGAMIGSGIFILPGLAMAEAGPAVVLAFVFAAVLVLPAALSIAELGTAMPEAGGDYIFIERGMGPAAGTIAGLGTWLMLMFKGALALVGGMFYVIAVRPLPTFELALPATLPYVGSVVTLPGAEALALTVGVVLIAVNVFGVKQTGGLQTVMVAIMLVIMAAFVAASAGNIETEQYGGFFDEGAVGLVAATAMVLISYGGVTKVAAVSEEIENPSRNLPLGLMISLAFTTALYALIVAVLVGVVEPQQLAGTETPMVDAVEPFFGVVGVVAIVLAAMLALISTANAGILTASRYPFALSRDNLLPEAFAHVDRRVHTPVLAILVTGGAMLFIILSLPVEEIAKTAGAFQIVVYVLVCLALMAFRTRDPEYYDPDWRSPAYPYVQMFGVVAGVGILTQMDTLPLIGGVGIVVLGFIWYLVYGRPRVDRRGMLKDAVAETIQKEDREKPYRVVVPVADPEDSSMLLRMAAASASKHDDSEIVAVNVIEVPDQTSLSQELEFEEERVEGQQALLDEVQEVTRGLGVGVRTHAVVAHDVGDTVLSIVREEDADEVVMGWKGGWTRREHLIGAKLDPVIERAPCEVTLVKRRKTEIGDVAAFVGSAANATKAVERAADFTRASDAESLTLVNVQSVGDDESEEDAVERGRELVERQVEAADVDVEYEIEVEVSEYLEDRLVAKSREFDTVCMGLTGAGSLRRVFLGSLGEYVGRRSSATVALVRGEEGVNISLMHAVADRLKSYSP